MRYIPAWIEQDHIEVGDHEKLADKIQQICDALVRGDVRAAKRSVAEW